MFLSLHKLSLVAIAAYLITVQSEGHALDVEYQREVKPILTKYCIGCHNEKDNESEVQLQSFANIIKGGPKGAIVVPNDPTQSIMLKMMLGTEEPKMPPEDSPQPNPVEIAVIQKWIEQGAKGSDVPLPLKSKLNVINFPTVFNGLMPITAIGRTGSQQLLIGRFNAVYLKQEQWSEPLPFEIVGKVTQARTTNDGRFTVIASGIPGVGGQATVLENVSERTHPTIVRIVEGHQDTLYTAVLSPDAKVLATAGYDRVIMLWNMADGTPLRKLTGHNGAIYDL